MRYTVKCVVLFSKCNGYFDGTSETDGLAATALPLPGYPKGILVVQDGHNQIPTEPQNFKIIDWRQIEPLISSTEE